MADERARIDIFSILYRAAEPDISRAGVRERADLRHGGIGPQRIRLARFRELSPDFIAGYQDSAVYDCPTDAVTGSQYSPDYRNLATAAEIRRIGAAEYYFRYRFRVQQ